MTLTGDDGGLITVRSLEHCIEKSLVKINLFLFNIGTYF